MSRSRRSKFTMRGSFMGHLPHSDAHAPNYDEEERLLLVDRLTCDSLPVANVRRRGVRIVLGVGVPVSEVVGCPMRAPPRTVDESLRSEFTSKERGTCAPVRRRRSGNFINHEIVGIEDQSAEQY